MALVPCEYCREVVDTKALGVYSKHLGWSQKRKQGGTNSITLASEPLGWAHGSCIEQQKKRGTVSWSEESLFD